MRQCLHEQMKLSQHSNIIGRFYCHSHFYTGEVKAKRFTDLLKDTQHIIQELNPNLSQDSLYSTEQFKR